MKIILRAGGLMRSGPERDLTDEYIKRAQALARGVGFLSVSEQAVDLKNQKTRAEETKKLLQPIETADELILLDERGKTPTSRDISRHFARRRDEGTRASYLLIGGADGFDPETIQTLRTGQITRWAFGAQTWPHKFVRVMAAEQIYRALSILANTPYHRD